MVPNERPYMISYMCTIQKKTLSLALFEMFDRNACMTFDLGSRSKVMAPTKRTYMISYMCTIQMKSLSLIVFEVFVKKRV